MASSLRNDTSTCFCEYGGFTFPSPVHTTVQCVPRYDPSDRSITSRKYTIHLETTLVSEDFNLSSGLSIDSKIESLRVLLTTEGLALSFRRFGYGDLIIARGNQVDVNYGPKPRLLSMRVIAPTNAIFLAWEVEVVIWEGSCTLSGKGFPSDFEYFVYTVNFSMDESLIRTRTINIEAMTLASRTPLPLEKDTTPKNRVQQNAGSSAIMQELLTAIPTLQGFRRSVSDNISNDLQKVQVTITDTEIDSPNPYYVGCSHIDIRHRASIDFPLNSTTNTFQIVNSMSGTIRTNPNQSKGLALKAFITIFLNRLQAGIAGTVQAINGNASPSSAQMTPIINHLEFEESVFGRESSFSVSWFFTTTLQSLMRDTGLWSEITDPPAKNLPGHIDTKASSQGSQIDWEKWRLALDASAQRIFELSVEDSDIRLTNYCNPFNEWGTNKDLNNALKDNSANFPSTNDLKTSGRNSPGNNNSTNQSSSKQSIPTQLGSVGGTAPKPKNSWVRYQVHAKRHATPNVVRVPLLDTPPAPSASDKKQTPGIIQPSASNASPDRIEQRSTGFINNHVIVSGYAIRFGNLITLPDVTKLGDQDNPIIVRKNCVENKVIAVIFGVPLYYSSWNHVYYGLKEQEDLTLDLHEAPYAVQGDQSDNSNNSPSVKTITIKAV